jgi:polyphosphate kinase 2 (PPK2 family)
MPDRRCDLNRSRHREFANPLNEMDDVMALKRTAGSNAKEKMKRKAYEKELRKLQVELCHLQDWVKAKGARIIVVFEGRDAAGKGGTIKAISERVSPRVFRVVALPAPRIAKRRRCSFSVMSSGSRQAAKS